MADRLEEIEAKWFRDKPGHEQRESVLGVMLCCIAPDARECLDDVMVAWEGHYQSLKRNNPPDYEPGFYGFAYWLIRWSGLVLPRQSAGADMAYLIGEVERLRSRATLLETELLALVQTDFIRAYPSDAPGGATFEIAKATVDRARDVLGIDTGEMAMAEKLSEKLSRMHTGREVMPVADDQVAGRLLRLLRQQSNVTRGDGFEQGSGGSGR